MAADHLYLAAERAALTERLGVRWGPVDERSGAAEIVGLDERALIERFSKRSVEIDDWLTEHGLSGIKASSAAAVATRAPKDHSESEQSVYERWQRELAEAGIGERELSAALTGGRGRLATPKEVERALTWLASADGLAASASTFTRADVVDALAKRLPVAPTAQAALTQAETLAERFLAERSVVIGRDRRLGVERYSTPELLERERELVAAATQRREERTGQVRPEVVGSVLDRHQTAGADQAAMVEDVTRSGAGVSVVVGRAGSGKTWALGLAREAFELDGHRVLGTAPTGIAAVGLGDEGFSDIRTVDRLLADLGAGRAQLDAKTVLVVDEAAMLGTRKLSRLLDHAHDARGKVILVGDDRQFAAIEAGGGFRALRQRLGSSELTVNRRQVAAWEQRAIDDLRAGRVEQAIAAYAEHDRIRAYDASDDRDRALIADWWQAHEAGERPVIFAHRRAQVDQLNQLCQRLRAEHGQLGPERLAVGDRSLAVGDRVVLGANALDRLGVANGTSAEITALDVRQRTMTIRTVDEDAPRTVTLPSWYLDAQVRPGQSRRVDLAYARTDMRSQGRTEQRALLALDGAEDMQGGYVQLTRGKERTDMYLTVGPEPLGDAEAHPHPRGEAVEPERLLGRVLTRDGSKTLASDTPTLLDVRRLSTRQLREERDRLAALRAECPADRARELALARQRAAELDTARRAAASEQQAAAADVAQAGGSVLRRRDAAAARERLALAEHAVRATGRQATQAAERAGLLRRAEAERAGWLEQHADLPAQERATARELAWRGRVDARAVALEQPGWLVAELGPMPAAEEPAGRAAWLAAAVELDTWRRTHGLDDERPAEQGRGQRTRPGRNTPAATARQDRRPTSERATAGAGSAGDPADQAHAPGASRRGGPRWRHPDRERPTHPEPSAARERTATAEELLGAEPGRSEPGRRRDWQQARAALERLAAHRERTRDPDQHRSERQRDQRRAERSPAPHERAER
jgi:hypothetical protein